MSYFPPQTAKANWGEQRHNLGRLGSCTVNGQFWWLWSQQTSKGYYSSCWQCKPYTTWHYTKSPTFPTEAEAIVWVEKEIGLNEGDEK